MIIDRIVRRYRNDILSAELSMRLGDARPSWELYNRIIRDEKVEFWQYNEAIFRVYEMANIDYPAIFVTQSNFRTVSPTRKLASNMSFANHNRHWNFMHNSPLRVSENLEDFSDIWIGIEFSN